MQTILDILEWPAILTNLESFCQPGYGRLRVRDEELMLSDAEAIREEMARVDEARVLLQRFGEPSLTEPPDVVPALRRLQKGGAMQSPGELSDLLVALRAMRQVVRFFIQNKSREQAPRLMALMEGITLPNPGIEQLEGVVSDQGELLDSASPEYARLRLEIRNAQAGVRQYFQNMIHRSEVSKYLQEPIVTEREGRLVLPVKAEHKVDVPGIVHGTSATGVTLYIEPNGAVEQNNRLVSLRGNLEREIRRILNALSETLAPEAELLLAFIDQAAGLDLLLAKARQSLRLKANPVEVLDTPGTIYLRQARHPLLMLQPTDVVPNDVIMEPPQQVMLITGPNTGGKTVLLKLVGLCALMVRAGLHPPVAEGSRISLFDPVLADIGDPQSIEQNLSTFSGHMKRLNGFLETPSLDRSLVLVDEICAGTDPQEGSALAQALLETFQERGATCIVTTHIGELKVFAHQHEGFLNASVEFDAQSLRPTYRLILGVPGTSNALNIASRLGIPDAVIGRARAHLTQPASDSAKLIESLETKNRQLTFELEEAQRLRQEIQYEEEQIRQQLNRIEGEKRKTLQLYREGLKDKLRGIEREVEELKAEVRKPKKPNRQTAQHVSGKFRRVQSQTGELFMEETDKLYPTPGIAWDSLKVGDVVESKSLNLSGTIIEKHPTRQELTLQAGMLKTTVPLSDIIQKVGGEKSDKSSKKSRHAPRETHGKSTVHLAAPRSYAMRCDLRGMNSEEALALLDKILDDAMVSGAQVVDVIHGLGTGVLKKAVRAHLKTLPYIKNYGPAPATEGGDGKTIVEL